MAEFLEGTQLGPHLLLVFGAGTGEPVLAPDIRVLGHDRAVGVDVGLQPVDFGGQPFDRVILTGRGLLAVESPHRRGQTVEEASEFAASGGRRQAAGECDNGGQKDRRNRVHSGCFHRLRSLPLVGIFPLTVSPSHRGVLLRSSAREQSAQSEALRLVCLRIFPA